MQTAITGPTTIAKIVHTPIQIMGIITTQEPAPCQAARALGRPGATEGEPGTLSYHPTRRTPLRAAERAFSGLSTGCCDLGQLSTLKHQDSFPVKHQDTAPKSPVKHQDTQVAKDQVERLQVVEAATAVDNSLKTKEKPPEEGGANAPHKSQTKPFLIGKRLKTKDLLQIAADRASGTRHQNQDQNPRIASAKRRVKPLARLLRCATALRVTAPLGCG